MRTIKEINVHCSATRPEWMAAQGGAERVAEIRRWHVQQNGWKDIGYHWLIDRDGTVYPGRPESQAGAFEPKVNATAVGVCLLGGFGSGANDAFEDHYTAEQGYALRDLIEEVRARYPTITKVTGHNDYAPKACPGFNVSRWLKFSPPRKFVNSGTAAGAGTAAVGAGGLAIEQVFHALAETRSSLEQAQAAQEKGTGVDPIRTAIVVVILAGALFALWRRWRDWKSGRQ